MYTLQHYRAADTKCPAAAATQNTCHVVNALVALYLCHLFGRAGIVSIPAPVLLEKQDTTARRCRNDGPAWATPARYCVGAVPAYPVRRHLAEDLSPGDPFRTCRRASSGNFASLFLPLRDLLRFVLECGARQTHIRSEYLRRRRFLLYAARLRHVNTPWNKSTLSTPIFLPNATIRIVIVRTVHSAIHSGAFN